MTDKHFMAKNLASSTHELQNILAIIKESSCLVEDVLQINGKPRMKHGDKLYHSLEVIGEQVDRAKVLLRALNSFAHAVSDGAQTCDLVETGKQTAQLVERFVRLKEHALQVVVENGSAHIACPPEEVIEALHSLIIQAITACTPKAPVLLRLGAQQNGQALAIIEVAGAAWNPEEMEQLAAKAGGSVVLAPGVCTVQFPCAASL
ncbi:HAMP domain-containing histidine kinase [Desulfovibrio cuneatus]|uniref:HAMP domain-containing histidine kinase n=1 Tax=Desulfovibrio cuneatus TaxID=159728 RepID=UPI000412E4DB|nr:HAMP domain-containing histidine kinase [Desulfovibrio cuneatus]